MTVSNPEVDGPKTVEELQSALNRTVRQAYQNGVDVEGGFDCVDRSSEEPDWTIEISEIMV